MDFSSTRASQHSSLRGGIGITPIRSMIKETIDTNADVAMTLIYQNHTDDFPFKHELDAWAQRFRLSTVQYVPTGIPGHLTPDTLRALLPDIPHAPARSYIAGPPGMVLAFQQMLHLEADAGEDERDDTSVPSSGRSAYAV